MYIYIYILRVVRLSRLPAGLVGVDKDVRVPIAAYIYCYLLMMENEQA
jgi:hypothetical protein